MLLPKWEGDGSSNQHKEDYHLLPPWGNDSETCPGPSEQTPLGSSPVSPRRSAPHTHPVRDKGVHLISPLTE